MKFPLFLFTILIVSCQIHTSFATIYDLLQLLGQLEGVKIPPQNNTASSRPDVNIDIRDRGTTLQNVKGSNITAEAAEVNKGGNGGGGGGGGGSDRTVPLVQVFVEFTKSNSDEKPANTNAAPPATTDTTAAPNSKSCNDSKSKNTSN